MNDIAIIVIIWLIVMGFMTFIVIWSIKESKKQKVNTKESKIQDANTTYEPTYRSMQAKVIDQKCSVKMVGTKNPKTLKEFSVVFELENGEILKMNIPEEMYDGFEIGQTGLLTIADKDLYSFETDETI